MVGAALAMLGIILGTVSLWAHETFRPDGGMVASGRGSWLVRGWATDTAWFVGTLALAVAIVGVGSLALVRPRTRRAEG